MCKQTTFVLLLIILVFSHTNGFLLKIACNVTDIAVVLEDTFDYGMKNKRFITNLSMILMDDLLEKQLQEVNTVTVSKLIATKDPNFPLNEGWGVLDGSVWNSKYHRVVFVKDHVLVAKNFMPLFNCGKYCALPSDNELEWNPAVEVITPGFDSTKLESPEDNYDYFPIYRNASFATCLSPGCCFDGQNAMKLSCSHIGSALYHARKDRFCELPPSVDGNLRTGFGFTDGSTRLLASQSHSNDESSGKNNSNSSHSNSEVGSENTNSGSVGSPSAIGSEESNSGSEEVGNMKYNSSSGMPNSGSIGTSNSGSEAYQIGTKSMSNSGSSRTANSGSQSASQVEVGTRKSNSGISDSRSLPTTNLGTSNSGSSSYKKNLNTDKYGKTFKMRSATSGTVELYPMFIDYGDLIFFQNYNAIAPLFYPNLWRLHMLAAKVAPDLYDNLPFLPAICCILMVIIIVIQPFSKKNPTIKFVHSFISYIKIRHPSIVGRMDDRWRLFRTAAIVLGSLICGLFIELVLERYYLLWPLEAASLFGLWTATTAVFLTLTIPIQGYSGATQETVIFVYRKIGLKVIFLHFMFALAIIGVCNWSPGTIYPKLYALLVLVFILIYLSHRLHIAIEDCLTEQRFWQFIQGPVAEVLSAQPHRTRTSVQYSSVHALPGSHADTLLQIDRTLDDFGTINETENETDSSSEESDDESEDVNYQMESGEEDTKPNDEEDSKNYILV